MLHTLRGETDTIKIKIHASPADLLPPPHRKLGTWKKQIKAVEHHGDEDETGTVKYDIIPRHSNSTEILVKKAKLPLSLSALGRLGSDSENRTTTGELILISSKSIFHYAR